MTATIYALSQLLYSISLFHSRIPFQQKDSVFRPICVSAERGGHIFFLVKGTVIHEPEVGCVSVLVVITHSGTYWGNIISIYLGGYIICKEDKHSLN